MQASRIAVSSCWGCSGHFCADQQRYLFTQIRSSLQTQVGNEYRRKPEAHVGTVPHWRRPCTWWSCGACSPRCSCRTWSGAPSPEQNQLKMFNWDDKWMLTIADRSWMISCLCCWTRTVAAYLWGLVAVFWTSGKSSSRKNLLGWASWLPTTAAMLGFLLSPTGGWVTSAPRKITWTIKCVPKFTNTVSFLLTGSLKTFGLMDGTRIEFTPPSFTLI